MVRLKVQTSELRAGGLVNIIRDGHRCSNGTLAGYPVAAGLALLTCGCNRGILDPAGPVGSAEKQILINSTAIMLAIIVPTMIATIAVAFWFRRGNSRAAYRPDWEYSGAIELVVWAIPALTIMLLGGIAWIGSHDLEPSKPLKSSTPAVRVDVVSMDWKWLFIYPDQHIATVNQLVVPAHTPVSFRLTSATVWNVFFVPQLGTQIYTMPRMTTRLNLEADRQGTFDGFSAHFSGDGFPGMRFQVHSVPQQQFAAWVQSAKGAGPVLDQHTYALLSQPTSYVKPMTFSNVDPRMFDAIATGHSVPPQQLPHSRPAPGIGSTGLGK